MNTPGKHFYMWVTSTTPADFFINSEWRLKMIIDMLIQQISLQQLCCICVYFEVTRYRNKTKLISITLIIKNWSKTIDLRDMMGYNKRSSKNRSSFWKKRSSVFWIVNKELVDTHTANFMFSKKKMKNLMKSIEDSFEYTQRSDECEQIHNTPEK